MAEEGRGVSLAILGVVAVIAVVGLVLLFAGGTGRGVYGGEMYQSWDDPLRQPGEEVARYTSPVPVNEGGTYYSHRQGWEFLLRDYCPDAAYRVVFDQASAGGRTDCISSAIESPYVCCAFAGQAGSLQTGGLD